MPVSFVVRIFLNIYFYIFHPDTGEVWWITWLLSDKLSAETLYISSDYVSDEKSLLLCTQNTYTHTNTHTHTAFDTTSDLHSLSMCLLSASHVLPLITAIINTSYVELTIPVCFKKANVGPLRKTVHSDKEVFNNYRPVSNVPVGHVILHTLRFWRFIGTSQNCTTRTCKFEHITPTLYFMYAKHY